MTIADPGTLPADTAFINAPVTSTVYVAKTGCPGPQDVCQESNNGMTRQTAKPRIDLAIPLVQPGGEIRVYPSETPYEEYLYIPLQQAGSSATPKFIIGVPDAMGKMPRIVPKFVDGRFRSIFNLETSYWIIKGVDIDCMDQRVSGVVPLRGDHLALLDSEVHHCRQSAVLVRGSKDVVIRNNVLHHNQDFQGVDSDLRYDSSGVDMESWFLRDASNAIIVSSITPTERVLIERNTAYANSGDGVQCQGGEAPGGTYYPEMNSRDVTIRDNLFHDNLENAVDIKSCLRVSITGSNQFYGYDHSGRNGGRCGGSAVIVHFNASKVLVEGARIHDSGIGVELGSDQLGAVQDIIIRRNSIYRMNQNYSRWAAGDAPGGRTGYEWKVNCGDGIKVNRAQRAEIYHNTLDNLLHSGIKIRSILADTETVRVWNNIISDVSGLNYIDETQFPSTYPLPPSYVPARYGHEHGGYLDYDRSSSLSGLVSEYNLFHKGDGTSLLYRYCPPSGSCTQQSLATFRTSSSLDLAPNSQETPANSTLFVALPDSNGYFTQSGTLARNTALVDAGNSGQDCASAPDKGALESDCAREWTPYSAPLSASTGVTSGSAPSLQVDASGLPVVAWSEAEGEARAIHVRRLVGGIWQPIGDPLSASTGSGTHAETPQLVLNAQGHPVVAWSESNGTGAQVHVWAWTGSQWTPYGGGLRVTSSGYAFNPSLKLDASGDPVVAWRESPNGQYYNGTIHVSRWNNGSWSSVGGAVLSMGDAFEAPSLEMGGDDEPRVAWSAFNGVEWRIFVAGWTGTAWQAVGSDGINALTEVGTGGSSPSLKIDGSGRPLVAFSESMANEDETWVFLFRWNGTSWDDLGGKLNGDVAGDPDLWEQGNWPVLELDGVGNAYVAYRSSFSDYRSSPYSHWSTDFIKVRDASTGAWTTLSSWFIPDSGPPRAFRVRASGEPFIAMEKVTQPWVPYSNGVSGIEVTHWAPWL
ncbi:right-handed parallel beta-helix repeat-containing protein [Hyalangium minutum]|uniref:Right handed beta helix domain-containing protein n=1 Tax=Hyalangium minutum TaxID=394096 RepID=A0A085WAZ2_9BACT|nr:right-handed parallel beta-helix repeat-containing protein [Hyalangium minutum]KFE64855.1 hypothetical protein DB31_1873 [Hyalangium minutum]